MLVRRERLLPAQLVVQHGQIRVRRIATLSRAPHDALAQRRLAGGEVTITNGTCDLNASSRKRSRCQHLRNVASTMAIWPARRHSRSARTTGDTWHRSRQGYTVRGRYRRGPLALATRVQALALDTMRMRTAPSSALRVILALCPHGERLDLRPVHRRFQKRPDPDEVLQGGAQDAIGSPNEPCAEAISTAG